jgi:hypothetical protein
MGNEGVALVLTRVWVSASGGPHLRGLPLRHTRAGPRAHRPARCRMRPQHPGKGGGVGGLQRKGCVLYAVCGLLLTICGFLLLLAAACK